MRSAAEQKPRQRTPAATRREELIAAAIEEFALGGLHGTPVERIARRVGVAQPYVFSLFATKRDLFVAAVERGFQMAMDLFSQGAAQFEREHPAGDYEPEELLAWLGDSYIELLAADRTKLMFQLQAYAACEDEVIRARVNEIYARLERHLRELTGVSEDEVNEFLSHGMWLNVQAAIGRADLRAACAWIKRRREGERPPGLR